MDVEESYGLTLDTTYEGYLNDPVCQLRLFNYKVAADISLNRNSLSPMLTIIDTGAGPNLIRRAICLEKSLLNIDTTKHIANFRGSSLHKLHTLGIVKLTVQVGTQTNKLPFVVVRNLGGPMSC